MSEPISAGELRTSLEDFRRDFAELEAEIGTVIVGNEGLIRDILVAIVSRGLFLLVGVPGLGKTTLVKVLGTALGLEPGRVQCTPDLMPADVLGTQVIHEDESRQRSLRFVKGPVFANIVLVDEVNRATPKTQSALLEVMQEQTVTAGGERHELPDPFFVLATQNPMEMEGTYPLPEAQLDRFLFKCRVPFPSEQELVEISRRTTQPTSARARQMWDAEKLIRFQRVLSEIAVSDEHARYAASLVLGTHPDSSPLKAIQRYVAYGASPRGMQALIRGAKVFAALDDRLTVAEEDVKRVAMEALRHRVILNFEGEAESLQVDDLVRDLLEVVPGVKDRVIA
ncbi:MAG: MoxR family ATPase [Verrucomicrobiota bacterium]